MHALSSLELAARQVRFVLLGNRLGNYHRLPSAAMNCYAQAAICLENSVPFEILPLQIRRDRRLVSCAACRDPLQHQRSNLLLTYSWVTNEWLATKRAWVTPHVRVENGFGIAERQRRLQHRMWARRVLMDLLPRSTLEVPSQWQADLARTWRVPTRGARYSPNGVSVAAYMRPNRPLPARRVGILGTVAGLRAERKVGRLAWAVVGRPPVLPARQLVVGDGAESKALPSLVTGLGPADRVEFTGSLSNPAAACRRTDLFALSFDTEQQPMSMMEAMAEVNLVCATRGGDVAMLAAPQARAALRAPDDAAFANLRSTVLRSRDQGPGWMAAGLVHLRAGFAAELMVTRRRDVFDGTPAAATASQALSNGIHA